MGRFSEGFFYGTPWYPLSDTPDGRIVSEIHRQRTGGEEYQRKSLALQEKALSELTRVHGGQNIIRPDEFQHAKTVQVLGDLSTQLQGLYYGQENTARALGGLSSITEDGLGRLHDDLGAIQGPELSREDIKNLIENRQDLLQLLGAYSKGILNGTARNEVESLINQRIGSRQWAEPIGKALNAFASEHEDYPRQAISIDQAVVLLMNPSRLINSGQRERALKELQLLRYYASKYSTPLLQAFIQRADELLSLFNTALNTPLSEDMLIRLARNCSLTDSVQHRVIEKCPDARIDPSMATMNYSLIDIAKASRMAVMQNCGQLAMSAASLRQGGQMLEKFSTIIDQNEDAEGQREVLIREGKVGIHQRAELLELERMATEQRTTSIKQGEMLLDQGNIGILQREASITQGDVLIDQGEITNYRLSCIINSIARTNEGIIDLKALVKAFAQLVGGCFHQLIRMNERSYEMVDARLQGIDREVVLTRVAVICQFKDLKNAIGQFAGLIRHEIERSNSILEELVRLNKESHQNEASQYFMEGQACLASAETAQDAEDAYNSFIKGTEISVMSAENYFGAGMAAEKLGQLELAKEHYRKAAQRMKENTKFCSQIYELIANIEFKLGDLPKSIASLGKAIENDNENVSARFFLAKVQALLGAADIALNILRGLMPENESLLLQLRIDDAFENIGRDKLLSFYKELLQNNSIRSPNIFYFLLEQFMEAGMAETTELFIHLCDLYPQILLTRRIWEHPAFPNYHLEISDNTMEFINSKINKYLPQQCYVIAIIFFNMNIDIADVWRIIRQALEQDPRCYLKDKKAAKQEIRDSFNKYGLESDKLWAALSSKQTGSEYVWLF